MMHFNKEFFVRLSKRVLYLFLAVLSGIVGVQLLAWWIVVFQSNVFDIIGRIIIVILAISCMIYFAYLSTINSPWYYLFRKSKE